MTPRKQEEAQPYRESSPPRSPESAPPTPRGDLGLHTVQAVLEMQRTLGGVETAIKHLEEESKEHRKKLEDIGKDLHAAKIVGGFIVLIAGFLGFVIHELIPVFSALIKPH